MTARWPSQRQFSTTCLPLLCPAKYVPYKWQQTRKNNSLVFPGRRSSYLPIKLNSSFDSSVSEHVKYSTKSLLTFQRPEDPPPKRRLGLCWEWNNSKQRIDSKQRIITRVIIDTIVSCGVDPALWLKSILWEVETSMRSKVSPNIIIIERHQYLCRAI